MSLTRTTIAAPRVGTTPASATACSAWRPRNSDGIPTMAETVVPNGLALCSVHHKALDHRAIGLEVGGGSDPGVQKSAWEECGHEAASGVSGEGDSVAG